MPVSMIATTTPSPVVRSHANGARVVVREAATSVRRSFSKPLLPLMPPLATTVISLVATVTRASVRIASRAAGERRATTVSAAASVSRSVAPSCAREVESAPAWPVVVWTRATSPARREGSTSEVTLGVREVHAVSSAGATSATASTAERNPRSPPKRIIARCVVPQSRDAFITRAGGGVDASRPRRYGSHQIALGRLRRLEREDDRAHGLQHRDVREKVRPDRRVGPHLAPLALVERARLTEHGLGHADRADVVEERAQPDRGDLILPAAETLSDRDGESHRLRGLHRTLVAFRLERTDERADDRQMRFLEAIVRALQRVVHRLELGVAGAHLAG